MINNKGRKIDPRTKAVEDNIEELQNLYEQGLSIHKLASRFGVSYFTIHRLMKKHNIPRRPVGCPHSHIHVGKLKELYGQGLTIQEIASKFEVSYFAVHYRMEKHNILRRPKGRVPKKQK